MITLLARWLIKAEPDANNKHTRHLYGVLCSVVGIALNLLLAAGKLVAGALSGSLAITADGLNNLSDTGSSLVTLIGFKLSQQKPDQEHPYGHGRMEYITGLIVAMAILLVGIELLKSSVDKIITPVPVAFSLLSVGVLAVSIAVKLYMAFYNRAIGRRIDSASMRATAMDSLSDAVATAVVLAAMLIDHFTGLYVDGWAGLLVSLFILYSGVMALRDTINLLLGQPPKQAYIDEIKAIVLAHPEAIGVHDVMVHDYGPGRRVITLHMEVSAKDDMLQIHDTVDNIERELHDRLDCMALIHMDPVDTDDTLTEETRRRVAQVVMGLDERATIHDFRMVTGPTHTNLIFDVSVPYDVKASEAEIKRRVTHMVRALDPRFYAVVTVDRSFEGTP